MGLRIAVVGAAGFFGTALVAALTRAGHDVAGVTRAGYGSAKHDTWDVVVNSAMPSRRFWARTHPADDFTETVGKTADLVYGWRYGAFVQISSLSARTERDTVYGRHKAAAEVLCERPDALVVRLTALYGETMGKGAIIDIVNDAPVYVDGASRYAFTPVEFAAQWVAAHLDARGLVEVGARDTISLADVACALGRQTMFDGPVENQTVVTPDPSWPSAADVIPFAQRLMEARLTP